WWFFRRWPWWRGPQIQAGGCQPIGDRRALTHFIDHALVDERLERVLYRRYPTQFLVQLRPCDGAFLLTKVVLNPLPRLLPIRVAAYGVEHVLRCQRSPCR